MHAGVHLGLRCVLRPPGCMCRAVGTVVGGPGLLRLLVCAVAVIILSIGCVWCLGVRLPGMSLLSRRVGCPSDACACVCHPPLSLFFQSTRANLPYTMQAWAGDFQQVSRFAWGPLLSAQPAAQLAQAVAWVLSVQPYRASCYGVRELSTAPRFYVAYLTGAQLLAAAHVVSHTASCTYRPPGFETRLPCHGWFVR
jgi:hypothetical protein